MKRRRGRRGIGTGESVVKTGGKTGWARRYAGVVLATGLLTAGCDIGAEIERPRPLFGESPVEYPADMWDRDVEGSTLVRVLVSEGGGVDSAVVAESSGYPSLDSAAVTGARAMRFAPALKGGEPLRVWTRVPVHFRKDADKPLAGPANEGETDTVVDPDASGSAGSGAESGG